MNKDIADIRQDYKLKTLSETEAPSNPFSLFSHWWDDAVNSQIAEVNAMTLATATPHGKVSARIVLLKDYNEEGFMFFTNYDSHKGNEIAQNSNVALVLFWKELERQIRIEGTAEKVVNEISDTYFMSRPALSQIGAWASPQSKVVGSRQAIDDNFQKFTQQFEDGSMHRPPHWGGYIVKPVLIEFWQGRRSRLHDRLQYTLAGSDWTIERLAP